VNLKITDIDPQCMTLRVKQGKGGKDRYAILSQNLLVELRQYWKRYRLLIWLFPNRAKNGLLSRGEAWHIFRSAKKRAAVFTACGRASPPIIWRQAWTCARSSF
jgi:integrase/recombinase XerD